MVRLLLRGAKVIPRPEIAVCVREAMTPHDRVVTPLGYMSRDFHRLGLDSGGDCLCCLGSMGSVLPLALGLSLTMKRGRVIAVEGDGSILMNLGALVTAKRYGNANLLIVLVDNRIYESTGGQQCQHEELDLRELAVSCGLRAVRAADRESLCRELKSSDGRGPKVVVASTAPAQPVPRIVDSPKVMAERFVAATSPTGRQGWL